MAKIIHWRIAKVAKAIAREAWELMAKEDAFYRIWPKPGVYVARNWKDYIPFARESLIGILAKDYSHEIALGTYTREGVEAMKEEVYEVLLIDSSFKSAPQGQALVH